MSRVQKPVRNKLVNLASVDFGSVETIDSWIAGREDLSKQCPIPPFFGCTKLQSVNLRSVQTIGAGTFQCNNTLTQVTVSKSAQIGKDAFPKGCKISRKKPLSAGNSTGQKRAKRALGAEN